MSAGGPTPNEPGGILLFTRGRPPIGAGLLAAIAAALEDPRVGAIGLEPAWPDPGPEPPPRSTDSRYRFSRVPVTGCLLAVRAETLREVGGMAVGHAGRWTPEYDLQLRLVRAHYRLARLRRPVRHRCCRGGPPPSRGAFLGHRYPRISVAIATRDYGRFLPRCLDSVLCADNPTDAPVQIVVADDCSTDGTPRMLARYRRHYPDRLTLVRLRVSGGVATAKNAAIRRAIGEYVALVDADDEIHPAKLARCYAALEADPRLDLVTHDYVFVEDDTGRAAVTAGDWCGGWRPPGVWTFRNGRVLFNEQMVCGYDELEWSRRWWNRLRRRHIAEPLAVVHGTGVAPRWKVDRAIAGRGAVTRWSPGAGRRPGPTAFACRACGSQYLRAVRCCGARTVRVPLVPYMVVASAPGRPPVETSLVVFAGRRVASARRLVETLRRRARAARAEWVVVHCRAGRRLLAALRWLARRAPVRAVFSAPGQPLVYAHDANRAARAACGRTLVFLAPGAEAAAARLLARAHARLAEPGVGIVVGGTGRPAAWATRREVFWALGAMDERATSPRRALETLGAAARARGYRVVALDAAGA